MAATISNITMAVASFNRLSPSTSMVRRFGALSSLKRAMTATGSVVEINAPKSMAAFRLNGVNRATIRPVTAVATSTPGTARTRIGTRLRMSSRMSRFSAASKMSVGIRM